MARKALFIVLILSLLAVPALAKSKPAGKAGATATATAPAGQTSRTFIDFGTRWTSMTDKERSSFLDGYYMAFHLLCTNAVLGNAGQDNQKPNTQEIQKQFAGCMAANLPFDPATVKAAMTELYQDTANNHIPYDQMIGFAFEKVAGKPYDDDLAKLRQDVENHLKVGK